MERAQSLNSGDVFILESPEQLYIWYVVQPAPHTLPYLWPATPVFQVVSAMQHSMYHCMDKVGLDLIKLCI